MAKVNGTVVVRNPSTLAVVVLHAGDDVPEWAEVGEHLTGEPDEPSEEQQEEPQGDTGEQEQEETPTPDDSWTNADIKQYAEDKGIDLGGATTKADMLAAIG